MPPIDAMRFRIHERLLAIDAANIELMKLVSLDMVGSGEWDLAVGDYRMMAAEFEDVLNDNAIAARQCTPHSSLKKN